MSEPVMRAEGLVKRYRQGPREIVVLDELELTVQAGERIAIVDISLQWQSDFPHASHSDI